MFWRAATYLALGVFAIAGIAVIVAPYALPPGNATLGPVQLRAGAVTTASFTPAYSETYRIGLSFADAVAAARAAPA